MVSRVYTPLIPAYVRPQGAPGRPVGDAEPPGLKETAQTEVNGGDLGDLRRRSSGLQGLQLDPQQKIPLNAVIHDFKNTMNALGADEQTRGEVAAYLHVVRVQASKEQPEVPFIKQTLRTAANSLDQFIGKALNQPSHVVKEWVDAVLMQDIDYHADLPPEETAASQPAKDEPQHVPTHHEQPAENAAAAVGLSAKSQLKSLIEAAKSDQRGGQPAAADDKLQQALALLADKDKPEWEGKVWHLRGRVADQSGRWEAASDAYRQAAQKFEAAGLPEKQANSLHALGSVLEEHGQLEQAKTYYQQVTVLDAQNGNVQAQLRSLNDFGTVCLRKGDAAQAVQTLQQAAQLAQSGDFSAQAQSDILSNLGKAYRQTQAHPAAIGAFRQSLQTARQAQDRGRYVSALQQLAAVYVEANQPEKAMKALQRLQTLG